MLCGVEGRVGVQGEHGCQMLTQAGGECMWAWWRVFPASCCISNSWPCPEMWPENRRPIDSHMTDPHRLKLCEEAGTVRTLTLTLKLTLTLTLTL